ncbi:hypothetical protein P3T73_09610 [Kiritimatiellota bacterium B12222]|nr:hypothetical protein P3T73_09610 [Kiritimatiellota bacterium B12222]
MPSPIKHFKALKHGDPQAVAFTAVTVFFISVCWFSWTFLTPQKTPPLPLGEARKREAAPVIPASLSEVLESQQVYLTPGDIPNPFYREPPKARSPRNKAPKTAAIPPRISPQRPPQNTATGVTPPPSSPLPNRPPSAQQSASVPLIEKVMRPLTLTYQGMLTRPDHSTVALVSIMEQDRSPFVKVGDKVDVFTVIEITPEQIQLQQADNPRISLPRGKSQKFEVPL